MAVRNPTEVGVGLAGKGLLQWGSTATTVAPAGLFIETRGLTHGQGIRLHPGINRQAVADIRRSPVSQRSKPASDRRVTSGHLPGAFRPTGHPTALPPGESCDGKCVDDGSYRGDSLVAIGRTVLSCDRATTGDPSGISGTAPSPHAADLADRLGTGRRSWNVHAVDGAHRRGVGCRR